MVLSIRLLRISHQSAASKTSRSREHDQRHKRTDCNWLCDCCRWFYGVDIESNRFKSGIAISGAVSMTPKHIHPGTDTTINPVVIDDSFRSKQQPLKMDNRCWVRGKYDCDGKCESNPVPKNPCGWHCQDCRCTACNQAGDHS